EKPDTNPIRHSDFVIPLIHIALITLMVLELLNVFVGLIGTLATLLLYDFAQHRIDIFCHSLRVAADKKVGALGVEPFPNLRGIVLHPVLDVNFLSLIPRPRAIEPREKPVLLKGLEFFAVSKIASLMLRSEEEPVLPLCPGRFAFLQVRAERRNSSSGPDHD